jgi:PAS domain S-box-containing protein
MAQEYGTGWTEGVHPDDLVRRLDVSAAHFDSRTPFETEYRLRRHDGEYRWVLDRGLPRFTPAGGFVGFIGMCIDITDRKEATERLREGEERFRTLADNMSQFAWMADETGWRFWFNRRWFDYTGLTPDEAQGWGWKKAHHPDHVNRVVAKLARCFATGEPWEDTFPLRGKDGEYRWFLSRAVPIRDDDG